LGLRNSSMHLILNGDVEQPAMTVMDKACSRTPQFPISYRDRALDDGSCC